MLNLSASVADLTRYGYAVECRASMARCAVCTSVRPSAKYKCIMAKLYVIEENFLHE